MKNLLTDEEKKYLRFMSRYISSLGKTSAEITVDMEYSDLRIRNSSYFDNFYPVKIDIPSEYLNIVEKILDYCEEIIDFEKNENITYQFLEVSLNSEKQELSVTHDWYYTEESDSSGVSWNSEEDPEIVELFNSMEIENKNGKQLSLSYNGGGDSGFIEDSFSNGKSVPSDVQDWCYGKLESHFGGWEINEGSTGEFYFDLKNKLIELNHKAFIESSSMDTILELSFSK